ncbi:MAG: hypothetical protein IKN63_02130 [Bacilli bacterium]|nr:hypothetical protein [Bacilli bacterium]
MKKIRLFLKNNFKLLIALIVGIAISGTCVYATSIQFDSNKVSFDNTSANLTKNGVAVTNVRDAIDALYEKSLCTNNPFNIGDYVSYTPTATSYDVTSTGVSGATGTLNPSELNLWRVIKINPNCTVEVVSEYVSTTNITFTGKDGYLNYVYILNEIAKQYADENHTYTLDPTTAPDGAYRNFGYDGATLQITNTTRIDNTTLGASGGLWYQKPVGLNGEESFGGGDQGFTTDLKLLSDAGVSIAAYAKGTTTPTAYWIDSRMYKWDDASTWSFVARRMNASGLPGGGSLYSYSSSSFTSSSDGGYAVRPVVTLKSGLSVSGQGTSDSPYVIN